MSSKLRNVLVACIIITIVGVGAGMWFTFPLSHPHAPAYAAGGLPYDATANGPYTVKGNMIVDASGQQYIFHGIGRDGLEYNCSGDGPLDQAHLAYMGSGNGGSGGTYWGANTVRLPLSEGFWLNGAPGYPCSAQQYQQLVKQVVNTLTSLKLNVILNLQWTDAGGQSLQGGGPWAMPDGDSVTFWQQVASMFSSYSNVLFEIYNEPHPANWSCWMNGCIITNDTGSSNDCQCSKTLSYQAVGMQTLVNTVRNTGATNLILVGGMNWGFDLSQVAANPIKGSNIVYDTHPYPYADKAPNTWDAAFGKLSATYPVISAESGEYDCGTSYLSQLLPYFDAHRIGWVAWAWTVHGVVCSYPQLVTDYQGTPSISTGQYIYQYLHSYSTQPGPVSKTWYFAEGRVGAGFKEFLTLDNPNFTSSCSVILQYLLDNGQGPVTKTITVPSATRVTESVNNDLGIPYARPGGVSVSTIASVNSTPSCPGVVVERPMYFSWHGINSGSDVLGATHLGTTFYFGDMPTGSGYASFITILNPPGNQPATVTATYYLGGKTVGFAQKVTVQPGTRGTISPTNANLPTHVAAVVTSTQPVMVERPDYFSHIAAGNAQIVSGATSIVGVQTLSNEWLFAEGYTGGHFQEYLVIANLDMAAHAPANVTINIEYDTGTTQQYTLTVNSLDQVIWNVNQHAPVGNISAEVTSTGAKIVVERELFFQYNHTINLSNGFQVVSIGGTDVIGQPGSASIVSFSFAEGYSNYGYNEWLTLQNPMSNDEIIEISMINGYGRIYKPAAIVVHAHSRYTLDVSALVLQYMVQPGNDHRGYEVSMTVQTAVQGASFVAERPMYWNTGSGGTVGGSDITGYTGA
jgi:endoglucanase